MINELGNCIVKENIYMKVKYCSYLLVSIYCSMILTGCKDTSIEVSSPLGDNESSISQESSNVDKQEDKENISDEDSEGINTVEDNTGEVDSNFEIDDSEEVIHKKYPVKVKEEIQSIESSIKITDLELEDRKTLGNSIFKDKEAMQIDNPQNLLDYSKEQIDSYIPKKYNVVSTDIPRYITEQGGNACWMRLEYIDYNDEKPSSVIFDMENISTKEEVYKYIEDYLTEHPILNYVEFTVYDIDSKDIEILYEKYEDSEDIFVDNDRVYCETNDEVFKEIMETHEGSFNIAGCDEYVLHVFSVSYNDGVYGLHIRMTYPPI